jgi:hypothetical protein
MSLVDEPLISTETVAGFRRSSRRGEERDGTEEGRISPMTHARLEEWKIEDGGERTDDFVVDLEVGRSKEKLSLRVLLDVGEDVLERHNEVRVSSTSFGSDTKANKR